MFEQSYLNNKAFRDQMMTFDQMPPQLGPDQEPLGTGAFVKENGDVVIRVYAPEAHCVEIRYNKKTLALVRQDNGVFEGTILFDERQTGPVTTDLYVDDALLLSPYLPIYWTANRPCNYVEIPDMALEFCSLRDVPHGSLSRELFFSEATGRWERCMVYTPAGYMKETEQEYPVLYLLNGGGDNEMCWEYSGKLSYTLDNLVADGKAVPFIVVMCNAMLREQGKVGFPVDLTFENMLLDEVIPFIEGHYRVKTGKWNRAIAGLSMGAYMTSDIILHHPEAFSGVGFFTASMVHASFKTSYVRPYGTVLKEISAEETGKLFQVFFRSTTPQEDHMEFFEADDAIYHYYGIDALPCYQRIVYPENTSKWNSWRMGLRDYAQLLFR